MSLSALLGTMQDALVAQQAGLDVTGQNITNVNTPGYVKRTAVLETRAVLPGNGGGVNVAEIQRAFDTFTYSRVLASSPSAAASPVGVHAVAESSTTAGSAHDLSGHTGAAAKPASSPAARAAGSGPAR